MINSGGNVPVYRGDGIELDLEYVLHRLNITNAQSARNKKFIEALSRGLEKVHSLARPEVVYTQQGFALVGPDTIVLGDEVVLKSGTVSDLLMDAQQVLIGIATIGSGLEHEAQVLKYENGLTASFALEALAAIALDRAVEEFFTHFESDAKSRGAYCGILMSPGESADWRVEDQRTLFEMHKSQLPGMRITDTCLLIPKNSISFLAGIYDHEVERPAEGHCNYCSMREKCIYRRRVS